MDGAGVCEGCHMKGNWGELNSGAMGARPTEGK